MSTFWTFWISRGSQLGLRGWTFLYSLSLFPAKLTGLAEELLLHVGRGVLACFDGHGYPLSRLQKHNFTLNSRGPVLNVSPSGCDVPTHQAVVNAIVHLSEETLAQDLAHRDVTSGNSVFI